MNRPYLRFRVSDFSPYSLSMLITLEIVDWISHFSGYHVVGCCHNDIFNIFILFDRIINHVYKAVCTFHNLFACLLSLCKVLTCPRAGGALHRSVCPL